MNKRKEPKKMKKSNPRIVGLDVHPDSFAGAILAGRDPASAQVVSTSTRVELSDLKGIDGVASKGRVAQIVFPAK